MGLADYKEIVGTSASICTMAQMFSGVFICRDIYKKGTAEGFDPMPFVGGLGIGLLMMRYALMLQDSAMISVNIFGLSTSVLYTVFFYAYTPKKGDLLKKIFQVMAVAMVFIAYAWIEDPEKIEFRWGLLITCLLFVLIGAPLFNIGEIIRTKNTDILPFPMIIAGTFVSLQWLLYGFIIDNGFMIFQNIVGFFLQIIQLSLFVIYPKKSAPKPAAKKE